MLNLLFERSDRIIAAGRCRVQYEWRQTVTGAFRLNATKPILCRPNPPMSNNRRCAGATRVLGRRYCLMRFTDLVEERQRTRLPLEGLADEIAQRRLDIRFDLRSQPQAGQCLDVESL